MKKFESMTDEELALQYAGGKIRRAGSRQGTLEKHRNQFLLLTAS